MMSTAKSSCRSASKASVAEVARTTRQAGVFSRLSSTMRFRTSSSTMRMLAVAFIARNGPPRMRRKGRCPPDGRSPRRGICAGGGRCSRAARIKAKAEDKKIGESPGARPGEPATVVVNSRRRPRRFGRRNARPHRNKIPGRAHRPTRPVCKCFLRPAVFFP